MKAFPSLSRGHLTRHFGLLTAFAGDLTLCAVRFAKSSRYFLFDTRAVAFVC